MIYSHGTVSTTANSITVTGSGSTWNNQVSPGDVIYIDGSSVAYFIAEVVSVTEISLTEEFAGGTLSGVPYVIVSDFSYSYSIPYPRLYDVEKASTMQRSVRRVDKVLDLLETRVFNLEYPAGVVLDITSTPTIDTIFIPGSAVDIDLTSYGIASAEAFGTHSVALAGNLVKADNDVVLADSDAITADASYGGALPTDTLYPSGWANTNLFGTPVVQVQGTPNLLPTGIPSDEAFGTASVWMGLAQASNNIILASANSVSADGDVGGFIPLLRVTSDTIKTTNNTYVTNDTNV